MSTTTIEQSISTWWKSFDALIRRILEAGRRPVVVALSRKMPRLLKWMRDVFIPEHPGLPSPDFLERCEVTTELSLPLRAATQSDTDCDFVLVDDVILHGTTIARVAEDLGVMYGLADREDIKCYVSAMFVCRRPLLPKFVADDEIRSCHLTSVSAVKKALEEISLIVRKYCLPLDMEFPILRGKVAAGSAVLDEVMQRMKDGGAEYCYSGRWKSSATAVYNSRPSTDRVDFRKVRFFMSAREVAFEFFAPAILPDFSILHRDKTLFKTGMYRKIWEMVLDPIVRMLTQRKDLHSTFEGRKMIPNIGRSLNVWANYLLSLQFMAETGMKMIPEHIRPMLDFDICDLKLLVGERFASEIAVMLKAVVEAKVTDKPEIPDASSPVTMFAPKDFASHYRLIKARLASHAGSVEEVIRGVFMFQHFSNKFYTAPEHMYQRLFYGETFGSLYEAGMPYFKGEEMVRRINRWIDDEIDNGTVVPKYERFEIGEGQIRWRRFFHVGLRGPDLPEGAEEDSYELGFEALWGVLFRKEGDLRDIFESLRK